MKGFKKDGKFRPTEKKNGVKKNLHKLEIPEKQIMRKEQLYDKIGIYKPISLLYGQGTFRNCKMCQKTQGYCPPHKQELARAGKDLGYGAVGMGLVVMRVDQRLFEMFEDDLWTGKRGKTSITENELKELITNVLYQNKDFHCPSDLKKPEKLTKSDIRNSGTFNYLYNKYSLEMQKW